MTTSPALSSTQAEGVRDYAADTPTTTRSLSVRYERLRTDVDMLGADVRENHNQMRGYELSDRTFEKAKMDVPALLSELAINRGMAWSNIAELAEVSVSAVRKWRAGGAATPEKRLALARIAAMLDLLEERGVIADPAMWMEMELPFDEPGYYIRPLDLYLSGNDVELLDIAEHRKTVSEVLDKIAPDWRQSRSEFSVYTDADGHRSITLRGN
jgi:hypothetical protein